MNENTEPNCSVPEKLALEPKVNALDEILRSVREALRRHDAGLCNLKRSMGSHHYQLSYGADRNEIIANLTLAHRHLEDCVMRLGKAIQAYDGGVSCYDDKKVKELQTKCDQLAAELEAVRARYFSQAPCNEGAAPAPGWKKYEGPAPTQKETAPGWKKYCGCEAGHYCPKCL